jgi:hypothetical protein
MFRKLRIAFSAVCGILCLALIVLRVRNYWWGDAIGGLLSQTLMLSSWSINGGMVVQVTYAPYGYNWYLHQTSLSQPEFSASKVYFFSHFQLLPNHVALPHWSVVVLSAAFGVLPWIKPSRQFSLRALLIATTLVAALLGAIVYAVR